MAIAVTAILVAFAAYTIAVWAERLGGRLQPWHVGLFCLGLGADTFGTHEMGRLAGGVWRLNFHTVTGVLALGLMAVHAVWATVTLYRGQEDALRRFHKVSVAVWAVWLVPFLSGPFLARLD